MKHLLWLALTMLSTSLVAFASTPRIDSLSIDEEKLELSVFGEFDSPHNSHVVVGDLTLDTIRTSSTQLVCKIPVSGRGAAGGVRVYAKGVWSSSRPLV